MKKNTKIKLIALNLFLLSNAALAASGNKDMKVSATVEKGCVVSASPYNFGDIKSSILFDFIMTIFTGGFWLIWVIIRYLRTH